MFFLNHFGTVVVGIWCSVDVKDINAGIGPAGMYLGDVSPVSAASPFTAQNGTCCSLPSRTGHGSVLACKVRVCFSCTQGFRVVTGKQDNLLLLLKEDMMQVRKG